MIGFLQSLFIVATLFSEGSNWWTGSAFCDRVLENFSLAIKACIWAFLAILLGELVFVVCCSTWPIYYQVILSFIVLHTKEVIFRIKVKCTHRYQPIHMHFICTVDLPARGLLQHSNIPVLHWCNDQKRLFLDFGSLQNKEIRLLRP
jgi:hypothetical protein